MFRKIAAASAVAVAAAVGLNAFSNLPASPALADHHEAKKDLVAVATAPGMTDVTTLVTALKAADLVAPLQGEGPFTVFAPTNAAFAKLPAGTLENLLKPENKAQLQGILLYHVHKGAAVMAKDVKPGKVSTLNGKELEIKVVGTDVMVNNAKVIKTDVVAGNGVIHLIDTVVLPPSN